MPTTERSTTDTLKILNEVIENTTDTRIYRKYSGRHMYGKNCLGISGPDEIEIIEEAAERGLKGARVDQLGRGVIVYWPDAPDHGDEQEEEDDGE
jgi:hypothetical protein